MKEFIQPPANDEEIIKEEELAKAKQAKKEAINNLVVENNDILYAGDDISQLRMASVIALANQQFNNHIGLEMTKLAQSPLIPDEAKPLVGGIAQVLTGTYNAVYKDNKIAWKGADKKIHQVQVESVAEALMKTMQTLATIVVDKEK